MEGNRSTEFHDFIELKETVVSVQVLDGKYSVFLEQRFGVLFQEKFFVQILVVKRSSTNTGLKFI